MEKIPTARQIIYARRMKRLITLSIILWGVSAFCFFMEWFVG